MSFKTFWNKAKDPVLYVALVVLMLLSAKNCSDNYNAGKETAATTENFKNNADTLKKYARAIEDVVKRTEGKVDKVQQTADDISAQVDSCCNCGCGEKPAPQPKPKPQPEKPDTVFIIRYDTICPEERVQSTQVKGRVTCGEVRGKDYYRIYGGR